MKVKYLVCGLVLAFACTEPKEEVPSTPPVISFSQGLSWGQPTFVWTDTTLYGKKRIQLSANFAASGMLKKVSARSSGIVFEEKDFENQTRFNYSIFCEVAISSYPTVETFSFTAEDYQGRIVSKQLRVEVLP